MENQKCQKTFEFQNLKIRQIGVFAEILIIFSKFEKKLKQ